MNEKGMIFSLDAVLAFVILLFATLVFATTVGNTTEQTTQGLSNFELEEKALMITDSLVKNYSSENTSLGSCITDLEKRRVRTNELSSANLRNAQPVVFDKIFLQKIEYKTSTRSETIQIEPNKKTKQCLSVKRFVLLDSEKGIVQTTICEEE